MHGPQEQEQLQQANDLLRKLGISEETLRPQPPQEQEQLQQANDLLRKLGISEGMLRPQPQAPPEDSSH